MIDLRQAFQVVLAGRSLEADEAEAAIGELLDGGAPEALVAGFLVALKLKRETAAELTGAARAMRARARALDLGAGPLLDTCGTGGDGAGTFNISTGAALIAATAGVRVAKHGNRAASGTVGAADAIERLGVKIDLDPDGLRRCLDRAGFCFIFAPAYHPAMARVAPLRRALGIRTLFNLLGPLANPGRANRQVLGVPESRLVRPMADALSALGVEHAMVVHGEKGLDEDGLDEGGLDEISLSAPTQIAELRGGDRSIREYDVVPEKFGIDRADPAAIRVSGPDHAVGVLLSALAGQPGPAQDVLALNAGAAIYVGGRADSFEHGVQLAREILNSGGAMKTIEELRRASHEQPAVKSVGKIASKIQ
jgi:anthranilate phosphoribosyltransferase